MHDQRPTPGSGLEHAPAATAVAAERSNLRAADADRQRVVAALQQHYVDGRLSQDEYDDRVRQALAARTFAELDALTTDLPSLHAPATPAASEPGTEQVGSTEDGSFRTHAMTYAMVMALLVAIWLLTTPGGYFWPVWPMLGWGFGLASHAVARGSRRRSTGARRRRA